MFLFSPTCPLQMIMKDKWINIGFENDALEPYVEPPTDLDDPVRIGNRSTLEFWLSFAAEFSGLLMKLFCCLCLYDFLCVRLFGNVYSMLHAFNFHTLLFVVFACVNCISIMLCVVEMHAAVGIYVVTMLLSARLAGWLTAWLSA